MKAISLLQPWASLVSLGAKKIETRSWKTNYRGPLAIHASKNLPPGFLDIVFSTPEVKEFLNQSFGSNNKDFTKELPRGKVIAICRLVDCIEITVNNLPPEPEFHFGDYTLGRYAWILSDVLPLERPIEAKGRLGFWDWAPSNEGNLEG